MRKLILLLVLTFCSVLFYQNISSVYTEVTENFSISEIFSTHDDTPVDDFTDENFDEDNGYTIFTNKDNTLSFILLDSNKYSFDLFYDPNTTKDIEEVSVDNNYIFSINGSYFLDDRTHAGLLIKGGEILKPLAPLDKQLSHVVNISGENVEFIEAANLNSARIVADDNFAFQTGPLIVKDNLLQQHYIEQSLNGETSHRRSFLGFTNTGKVFIGVATKQVSLTQLANELLVMPIWGDSTITVVNLDGGSSVALYSSKAESINYGTFKNLPIIIGVRKNF